MATYYRSQPCWLRWWMQHLPIRLTWQTYPLRLWTFRKVQMIGSSDNHCSWKENSFAHSVIIKLALPQAAQLSLSYGKITSVAPTQGTWIKDPLLRGKRREKAQLLPGIEPRTSLSVVGFATTWAATTASCGNEHRNEHRSSFWQTLL